jgi:hypothetical protein
MDKHNSTPEELFAAQLHDWLRQHYEYEVETVMRLYTKHATAKMILDHLRSKGITHLDGHRLSRGKIRQALVTWKRYGGGEHRPYTVGNPLPR